MPDRAKDNISRAPRNRTIQLTEEETGRLRGTVIRENAILKNASLVNSLVCADAFPVLDSLPPNAFDLVFADPPYNLTKSFGAQTFSRKAGDEYEAWLDSWISKLPRLLKNTASVYICGDWRSGAALERSGSRYFKLRNRITWEREKGRGAKANWKNSSEDIWFFTVSDEYIFNLDAIKQRRRVIAPYKENGRPKDWIETDAGNFRDTHPSNIWTDISVPFWSMQENTSHPTQKPEKLLAKIILAGTNPGDLILDPFAGSGTTAAVAKKLGRHFVAIESDEEYCLFAAKRLELADSDTSIQGYSEGIFWERNSGK